MVNSLSYCRYSLSPLRSSTSDASEMVSQVIFGEIVEILEVQNQWMRIRQLKDNYEGWMDRKFLSSITEKEMRRWYDECAPNFDFSIKISSSLGPLNLPMGSYLPQNRTVDSFVIGNETYSIKGSREKESYDLLTIANKYLGSPYLWGGKTPFGIDCSGFTQSVYRFLDINIPRDAEQQVNSGREINFEEREIGDLVFFKNTTGKIHHVGIVDSLKTILHAHGCVRKDQLSKEGIISVETGELTHQYFSIRRL